MSLTFVSRIVLAASLCTAAAVSHADQLDDIKAAGVLNCGTLGTSQPFSFQDNNTRQLVGFDVDICKLVAAKLGVRIEFKQMSVASRVPELNEKRVDIVAANLGFTPARAEQIAFSNQYFASRQMLMVRKESNISTIEQLDGRRVGAVKGSSSERDIKERLPKSTVTGYTDGSATYLALQQKKLSHKNLKNLRNLSLVSLKVSNVVGYFFQPSLNPTVLLNSRVFLFDVLTKYPNL